MKDLLRKCIREILNEISTTAYHGTSNEFNNFDPEKTTEFGIHFSVTPASAQHRNSKRLIEVKIDYQNPIHMPDLMRWDLVNIGRELKLPGSEIFELKKEAARRAKTDGKSMRVHENIVMGEKLDELGYDAIIYDNRGEAGGKAIIVWHSSQIKNSRDII